MGAVRRAVQSLLRALSWSHASVCLQVFKDGDHGDQPVPARLNEKREANMEKRDTIMINSAGCAHAPHHLPCILSPRVRKHPPSSSPAPHGMASILGSSALETAQTARLLADMGLTMLRNWSSSFKMIGTMITEHGGMSRVVQSFDRAMNGPILHPPCALVIACCPASHVSFAPM